jgi:hypothetical protein
MSDAQIATNGRELEHQGHEFVRGAIEGPPCIQPSNPTARSTRDRTEICAAPTYHEPFKSRRCLVPARPPSSMSRIPHQREIEEIADQALAKVMALLVSA